MRLDRGCPQEEEQTCRCFELTPMSKFLILRVWVRWCAKRTRGLYWFEQNVPTSSSLMLLVLLALKVYSRGYKRSRERQVPSLWLEERTGAESLIAAWLRVWGLVDRSDSSLKVRYDVLRSLIRCSFDPLSGVPCFPFDRPRESTCYNGRKEENERESPSGSSGLSFFFARVPLTRQVVTGTAPWWAPVHR